MIKRWMNTYSGALLKSQWSQFIVYNGEEPELLPSAARSQYLMLIQKAERKDKGKEGMEGSGRTKKSCF